MTMWRKFTIVLLLTLPAFSPPLVADAGGVPVNRILKQMSTAVRELNYHGLFTYEVGGVLDTYRIVHRVEDGIEYERLRRLNGDEREIVRRGHAIDCLSRGDELLRGILRSTEQPSLLHDNYRFYLTGDDRIADRAAAVVHIVPRDQHRFGYTLAMDKKTGLPLMVMRVNTDRRVMERIQFIDLAVGSSVSDDDVQTRGQHQEAGHDLIDCQQEEAPRAEPARWTAQWLPSGFVRAGEREIDNGDYMLTYTDGLATFSIFVSPPHSRVLVEGRAQIGASLAYMNQRIWNEGAQSVTVVGEIPFATAQRVVAELEPLR